MTTDLVAKPRSRALNGAAKAWLLRFHRWAALLFGLPLLGILASGLVLSVEPLVSSAAIRPGTVTPALVESILQRHDPGGRARGLQFRPYEGAVALQGVRQGGPLLVDLKTGQEVPEGGGTRLSSVFGTARLLHERLLLDTTWLVVASTAAMLATIAFGVVMGLPRLRNTLLGWHKGVAWCLLPLLVLSPITGLLMAFGVTFAPAAEPHGRSAPLPLLEAVQAVGAAHDLSAAYWIRTQGGRMLARINEGGEARVYLVGRDGIALQPRNWPRLVHEGTLSAVWGSLANLVTSLALLWLLGSGTWLWARRRWRQRAAVARQRRHRQVVEGRA